MKIIALINQKGGVAKTTSAINIAGGLSQLGKKVLVVDLDPQASLTYSLGIKAHELDFTVYDLLKGEQDFKGVMVERPPLTVIPSTLDMSAAEIELSGIPGRESLLKEALEEVKGFDYILIDCPPNLGLLTLNALTTAQEIYIPLQTEFLSLQGMSKLLEVVEIVQKRLNKNLEITGIIAAMYDGRKNLNREIVEEIRKYFGRKVFNTLIRDNIALAEAPSHGKTIFEYKPTSSGAEDYLNLSKEVLERS